MKSPNNTPNLLRTFYDRTSFMNYWKLVVTKIIIISSNKNYNISDSFIIFLTMNLDVNTIICKKVGFWERVFT